MTNMRQQSSDLIIRMESCCSFTSALDPRKLCREAIEEIKSLNAALDDMTRDHISRLQERDLELARLTKKVANLKDTLALLVF